jgi:hypothetical protein
MNIDLSALAFVSPGTYGGGGPGSADSFVNFSHTLGFPTSGVAFNVPTGYTVNSLDGTVMNNQFTPIGTTPEPNTLLMMGSGLFALCGKIVLRRKRAV